MSVSRKVLLPTLLFFSTAMIVLVGVFAYGVMDYVGGQEKEELTRIEQYFMSRLQLMENFSLALATEAANDPEIRDAFARRDRARLAELTVGPYAALEKRFTIPQYQYHLPPAISFFRVHQPKVFGDDLSAFRATVLAANREKKAVSGLEIGRAGLGMRGVVPISKNGEHLGTVEFGLDVDRNLLASLKKQFKVDWQLLLLKKPAEIATFTAANKEAAGPVPELLLQAATRANPVYGSAEHYRRALFGQDDYTQADSGAYSLMAMPLRDYSGAVIGLVEVVVDRSAFIGKSHTLIGIIFAVMSAALLFGGAVVFAIVKKALSPVDKLTAIAKDISQGKLERAEDIEVGKDGKDEISHLAGAFRGMAKELSGLIRNLEHKVGERTADLARANLEISQLYDRLKEENLRMGAELDVSRRIQQIMLPSQDEIDQVEGLDIATYMEPAQEVGGDYYDILRHEDGVRIGIGDVTGHGLESGVVMLMTQSAVRTLFTSGENDMARLMQVLNRTIYDNVKRMGCEKNLTLALLDYQRSGNGGAVRVSGQHESIVLVRKEGEVEIIDTDALGFPIGLVEEVADFVGEAKILLHPGDLVLLYTDGITEAADENNRLYGLERLISVVRENREKAAAAIKEAVVADVRRHIGAQTVYDDLTLVILKQK